MIEVPIRCKVSVDPAGKLVLTPLDTFREDFPTGTGTLSISALPDEPPAIAEKPLSGREAAIKAREDALLDEREAAVSKAEKKAKK